MPQPGGAAAHSHPSPSAQGSPDLQGLHPALVPLLVVDNRAVVAGGAVPCSCVDHILPEGNTLGSAQMTSQEGEFPSLPSPKPPCPHLPKIHPLHLCQAWCHLCRDTWLSQGTSGLGPVDGDASLGWSSWALSNSSPFLRRQLRTGVRTPGERQEPAWGGDTRL